MRLFNVAGICFFVCVLTHANPARAGGPLAGSKVQKLDAVALGRLIDDHIERRLKGERIPLSPRADDGAFLRRAYLDIHGIIPALDQARAYLDNNAPDRRARLIDDLLGSPRYA